MRKEREKEAINKNNHNQNQKSNKIRLMKKIESKDNTTSMPINSNNKSTIHQLQNRLIRYKTSRFPKNSITSSIANKTNIIDNSGKINKGSFPISSYMNRNSLKNNHINNIINSTFYLRDEDKQSKKLLNQSMFTLNRAEIIKRNDKNNNKDMIRSYRNSIDNKKEEYKRAYSKKKTEKDIQNKINKMNKNSFGKVNKYEKKSKNYIINNKMNNNKNQLRENNNVNNNTNINNINRVENNIKDNKNKFHRVKTLGELRKKNIDNLNSENEKKNITKNDNKNKKQKNNTNLYENKDKTQKYYNNLYDKYIDKFKDKMNKIEANKNYREEREIVHNNKPQDIYKKKNINHRKQNFQKTFNCREFDKNKNIKREYSQGEFLKENNQDKKNNNRKPGKSVGNAIRNNNKNKNKGKENNKNNEIKKNKKVNDTKNMKRSKSVTKLIANIKIKNEYEEKDDIESVMYDIVRPSKDDDPFDDVDSIVKAIDFDSVNIISKNIFRVDNEKYKNYCEKFENIFNKFITNDNQRKSVNNNEKNENNFSNLQSEKTTDSFKKTQINISFIENQN